MDVTGSRRESVDVKKRKGNFFEILLFIDIFVTILIIQSARIALPSKTHMWYAGLAPTVMSDESWNVTHAILSGSR